MLKNCGLMKWSWNCIIPIPMKLFVIVYYLLLFRSKFLVLKTKSCFFLQFNWALAKKLSQINWSRIQYKPMKWLTWITIYTYQLSLNWVKCSIQMSKAGTPLHLNKHIKSKKQEKLQPLRIFLNILIYSKLTSWYTWCKFIKIIGSCF